jgi:hypothetical protein
MRINVYSQELTNEVQLIAKLSNTGVTYHAAQLVLHSSLRLHHPPQDDDRSAVTFWMPKSPERREEMAQAFEEIARLFRTAPAETGLD